MPDPATDLYDPLLRHVADRIAPLFVTGNTSLADARATAISALTAYNPKSRADFVNIARILAFSIASLAALGLAAAEDLLPAQKIRYFGRANALNRSADQAERMMLRRRQEPSLATPAPVAASPTAKAGTSPGPDNAAFDAAIDEAMALCRGTPSPEAAPKPAHRPAQLPPMPTRIPAAVAKPTATPYRQSLLTGSAMPRVIGGNQRQPSPQ